jgi:hypothetical protein
MSFVAAIRDRLVEGDRRRSVRLIRPRVQLTLAVYLIAITLGFGLLVAYHSWAAYGRLVEGALATAPSLLREDITAQTHLYLNTSLALLGGYVLAILGVTIGYLHRVLGPTVALERYLHALERGEYRARLTLRSHDHLYFELAKQLNELASRLEGAKR